MPMADVFIFRAAALLQHLRKLVKLFELSAFIEVVVGAGTSIARDLGRVYH